MTEHNITTSSENADVNSFVGRYDDCNDGGAIYESSRTEEFVNDRQQTQRSNPRQTRKIMKEKIALACIFVLIYMGGDRHVVDGFSTSSQTFDRPTTTRATRFSTSLLPPTIGGQSMSWIRPRSSNLFALNGNSKDNDDEFTERVNTDVTTGTTTAAAVSAAVPAVDYSKIKPEVVPQRWVQLAYLSLLALLSDWVCFSVAAAPTTFESSFPGHSASSIIDIFLFTNVVTSFMVTDIVAKFGLQRAIQGAAIFMTTGCWLRAGLGFLPSLLATAAASDGGSTTAAAASVVSKLVDYPLIVAGTVLVGIAQPFFQCTPPLLSAKWFANNERSTSTAIALNFNQVGIATAFLIGGGMATTSGGLENYFALIAFMTTLVTLGTIIHFQNEPPVPPSTSELEKLISNETEPPFIESVQTFFATRGFTRPLAAFICSITITNVVGAFIDDVMVRGGVNGQFQIDLAGAGFELAIVAGGIILGGYVDKTKEYKRVTMACLAATALLVLPLGLTDHALGREPLLVIMALLGLGLAAGPVQPINAELAVDVTFPGDETAVESIQQIGGNLISALLIPIAEMASEKDYTLLRGVPGLESDIRGDVVLLIALAAITLAFFSGFDAPLARTASDESEDEEDPSVVLEVAVVEDAVPEKVFKIGQDSMALDSEPQHPEQNTRIRLPTAFQDGC